MSSAFWSFLAVLLIVGMVVAGMYFLGALGIVAILTAAAVLGVFVYAATANKPPWWAQRAEPPSESTALARPTVYNDNRQYHYYAAPAPQPQAAPVSRQLAGGGQRGYWVSETRYTAAGTPYLFEGYALERMQPGGYIEMER